MEFLPTEAGFGFLHNYYRQLKYFARKNTCIDSSIMRFTSREVFQSIILDNFRAYTLQLYNRYNKLSFHRDKAIFVEVIADIIIFEKYFSSSIQAF